MIAYRWSPRDACVYQLRRLERRTRIGRIWSLGLPCNGCACLSAKNWGYSLCGSPGNDDIAWILAATAFASATTRFSYARTMFGVIIGRPQSIDRGATKSCCWVNEGLRQPRNTVRDLRREVV